MTEQLFFRVKINSQTYQVFYRTENKGHMFQAIMINIQIKGNNFIITKAYATGTSEANARVRLQTHISTAIEKGESYASPNSDLPGEVKLNINEDK